MRFSRKLFLKEYRKSLSYLTAEEQVELKKWVRENWASAGHDLPRDRH